MFQTRAFPLQPFQDFAVRLPFGILALLDQVAVDEYVIQYQSPQGGDQEQSVNVSNAHWADDMCFLEVGEHLRVERWLKPDGMVVPFRRYRDANRFHLWRE